MKSCSSRAGTRHPGWAPTTTSPPTPETIMQKPEEGSAVPGCCPEIAAPLPHPLVSRGSPQRLCSHLDVTLN